MGRPPCPSRLYVTEGPPELLIPWSHETRPSGCWDVRAPRGLRAGADAGRRAPEAATSIGAGTRRGWGDAGCAGTRGVDDLCTRRGDPRRAVGTARAGRCRRVA